MKYRLESNGGITAKCIYQFDSITQMIEQLRNEPVNHWPKREDSQFITYWPSQKRWYGTETYQQAEELATNGWPEGAKKIKYYRDAFFSRISGRVHSSEFHRSVEPGLTFDIGSYCAGEPDHWLSEEQRIVDGLGNRILVVNYNISTSSNVPSSVITARGAAAVALVEALELAGYSVELNVVNPAKALGRGKTVYEYQTVRVKAPDQPVHLDILAFALAHPAMLRRFGFRITEHAPNKLIATALSRGYGMPVDVSNGARGDIYFPCMCSDDKVWLVEEQAVAKILAMIEKQGVDINTEN